MKTTPVTISSPIAVHPTPTRISFAGHPPPTTTHTTRHTSMATSQQPPYKSRSSSSASTSSSTSTSSASTPLDLQNLALDLLHTLYNTHDLSHASKLIHPNVTLTHNDAPIAYSREAYLEYWRARNASSCEGARWSCREAVVDVGQRKVWCVGDVVVGRRGEKRDEGEGKGGKVMRRKESVDMLSFDEQGRLVGEEDWVRVVKREAD